MILYHFCPDHLLKSIQRNGLTKGAYPLFGDGHITFIDGCQWLTQDKDPKNQSWNTSHLIDYNRAAFRLTIEVPENRRGHKLVKATDFIQDMPTDTQGLVLDWPGHENWYIFKGRIPPNWIKGCRRMEVEG